MIEHDQVERARQAQELLNLPLLQEALSAIEKDIVEMWADSDSMKPEAREVLWQHIRACRNFKAMLLGYINTGDMAKDRLKHLEAKQTLMQRFLRAA